MRVLLPVLVVALVASSATANVVSATDMDVTPATVDTTLYFHPIHVQDMPVNTQKPDFNGSGPRSAGTGPSPTLTCLDPYTGDVAGTGQGTGGMTSQELHTFYGYSSPGPVEYDSTYGGVPRTHAERGLAYNISINRSTTPVLHWFLAEDAGLAVGDTDQAPLANVVVRATLRQGESTSVDDRAYNTGLTLMQGSTDPVTAFGGQVIGDGASQVSASQVAGQWVYDFAVPLAIDVDILHYGSGFTVRIDVLADNPTCEDGMLMPGTAAFFADAEHQPRIGLRNADPLRVERASVRDDAANGTVALRWDVASPWGNYDVDAGNATLQVFGPADVAPVHAYTIQRFHEAYHHLEAVHQGWTLDAATLPDGRYTAVFTVPNLQHTAIAKATVTFNVQDGRLIEGAPQEAPALPPLALLVLLAALVAVRRR